MRLSWREAEEGSHRTVKSRGGGGGDGFGSGLGGGVIFLAGLGGGRGEGLDLGKVVEWWRRRGWWFGGWRKKEEEEEAARMTSKSFITGQPFFLVEHFSGGFLEGLRSERGTDSRGIHTILGKLPAGGVDQD